MKILLAVDQDKHPIKSNILSSENDYSKYFKSKEHELAFYLKINNQAFDKYLGIKKIHMIDVRKAKELKNEYLRIFHPDRKKGVDNGLNYDDICADISTIFHRVSGGKL
ncbi:hypothetical protein [Aeromonas caviae]|uniref:hypothetical protein n=1 Tax=Aeromonas caviae TaxID=648 RepID=UPI002B46AC44|nr:hypothetical protein [Aeromonas caviae]